MSKRKLFFKDLLMGVKFRLCEQKSNRVYVKVSPSQYAEITSDNTSCVFGSGLNAPEKEVELVRDNFYCDAQVM